MIISLKEFVIDMPIMEFACLFVNLISQQEKELFAVLFPKIQNRTWGTLLYDKSWKKLAIFFSKPPLVSSIHVEKIALT